MSVISKNGGFPIKDWDFTINNGMFKIGLGFKKLPGYLGIPSGSQPWLEIPLFVNDFPSYKPPCVEFVS